MKPPDEHRRELLAELARLDALHGAAVLDTVAPPVRIVPQVGPPRVERDPLTGFWHAYPRPGRVLKSDVTGLPWPYLTASDAAAALRSLGYRNIGGAHQ